MMEVVEGYFRKGLLGDEAEAPRLLAAGRWYCGLVESARGKVAVARWGDRVSGGRFDNIGALACKERLANVDAALGICLARGLKLVCVSGHSADVWAKEEGETRKGVGLAMLRVALRRLADVRSVMDKD